MQEITVTELKSKLDAGADIVVLDVREPHEWNIAAIDGTLRIPKGEIEQAKDAVIAGRNQF
jgi:adenylyltransferase/sulfurtransferase